MVKALEDGPRPLRLAAALWASRVYNLPPDMVMGAEMYDNWRRRLARLDRARRTATTTERRRAIRLARERLGGTL